MTPPSNRDRRFAGVWLAGCIALVGGGLLVLAANWVSLRDLSPMHNDSPAADAGMPFTAAFSDPVSAQLRAQGLEVADHSQAVRYFRDPRRDQELIVFIDARDGGRYEAGHVPGAYPFDPSQPEIDLPDLLPVCLTAETIVIYCAGRGCEDSALAARTLREVGVAAKKLVVYSGGFAEWETKGQPIEIGPRHSGSLHTSP